MDRSRIQGYADQADALARGPQVYGGPLTASVRCYVPAHQAHRGYTRDINGRLVGLGIKSSRILAVAQRTAGLADHRTSVAAIAEETQSSRSYVSKVLHYLYDRLVIGFASSRGRFGCLFIWGLARPALNVSSTTFHEGESESSERNLRLERPVGTFGNIQRRSDLEALWGEIGW